METLLGRRTECEKDQGEAEDEEQRVDERGTARFLNILEAQSRNERDVARNERQHTRRKKAQEPSAERDGQPQ